MGGGGGESDGAAMRERSRWVGVAWWRVLVIAGCAAGAAAKDAVYRSPVDVAFAPGGSLLAVADHTAGVVAFVDPVAGKVLRAVTVPGRPSGLAWDDDGRRVLVAGWGAGQIVEVDAVSGVVTRRIPVGRYVTGIARVPGRALLLAADAGMHRVEFVDLDRGVVRGAIGVSREPFAIAVTPDGRRAFVTHMLPAGPATDPGTAAVVSVLDLEREALHREVRLPAGSTVLRGVAVSPDGRRAYAVHTVGRFNVPTTQVERGWVNTNALTVIDAEAAAHVATVLLDHPVQGAADPWGVVASPGGAHLYITLSGVHRVVRVDVGVLERLLAGDLEDRPDLAQAQDRRYGGQNLWLEIRDDPSRRALLVNDLTALSVAGAIDRSRPRGIGLRGLAVSPDGKRLAAAGYYSGTVEWIDAARLTAAGATTLGPAPAPDPARLGEMFFHDATLCFQHWMSCATCHPGGARVDGLNWDLLNDGLGNPKNTRSLLFAADTPPMMSLGVRDTMETAVKAGFVHILFRDPSPEEKDAVNAYVRALQPLPSPHRAPDGGLTAPAARGKALFESEATKCATCHSGPHLTDLQTYDVGTRGVFGRADAFDTPALVELWRTAPYLHDGAAATLEDVLTVFNRHDRHGVTSHLCPEDIAALVAYLLSL